jgi:alcohol dehydrogenase class IV
MGLHHKLAHVLGGRFRLPHAASTAPCCHTSPRSTRRQHGPVRTRSSALVLAAGSGWPGIVRTRHRAPGADRLADLGLPADAIMRSVMPFAATPVSNPRDFTKEDVCYLVHQAYLGAKPSEERN